MGDLTESLEQMVKQYGANNVYEALVTLEERSKAKSLKDTYEIGKYLYDKFKDAKLQNKAGSTVGMFALGWSELSPEWKNTFITLGKEIDNDFDLDFNKMLKF